MCNLLFFAEGQAPFQRLISRDGKIDSLPLLTKREVADKILDRVVGLLARGGRG